MKPARLPLSMGGQIEMTFLTGKHLDRRTL